MELNKDLTQQQLFQYARDLKQTYDELTRRNKELEILNKKKTDFLEMVSHEIRTPSTILSMLTDLLLEGRLNEENRQEVLTGIKSSITRLDAVVAEIILANQQDKHEICYAMEEFRVKEIISAVAGSIKPFLALRNQNLEVTFADKGLMIKGNKLRLGDAFFNLLQNASKFSEDKKRIFVRIKKDKEFAVIEVEDHGIGIAKDKLGIIFNMFYEDKDLMQHHSGDFEFKSSRLGMGLYITRHIIEKHGGRINAESEVGKGTKFTVILPLAKTE